MSVKLEIQSTESFFWTHLLLLPDDPTFNCKIRQRFVLKKK